VIASLVFATTFFLWWQLYRSFIVDDAYITFRYARNLWLGLGPVYNPGDAPVEGYTSPVWMLLMVPGFMFGRSPELLSLILSGVCGVLLLLLFAVWAGRVLGSGWMQAFAVLWLGTNYTFVSWGSGGLETMGHAMTTLAAIVCFHSWMAGDKRRHPVLAPLGAGLAAAANSLFRPEGILLFCLEFMVALWALLRWRLPGLRARSLAVFWLAAALPVAAHMGWRLSFYGGLLPNTFYVKATDPSPVLGLRWLGGFLSGHFVHWAVFAALCAGCWHLRARLPVAQRRLWACLGIYIAAHLAYVVQLGGDVFEYRFLVQILPALALWLGLGAEAAFSAHRGARLPAVIAAFVLLVAGLSPLRALGYHLGPNAPVISSAQSWRVGAEMAEWRLVGEWLARYARKPESIALTPAGLIPYLCDLRTLDMLGLNDAHISRQPATSSNHPGHTKVAGSDYVRAWKPTYMLGSAWIDREPCTVPAAVCVQLKPGVYLVFRTLDRPPASLRKLLKERDAIVVCPLTDQATPGKSMN
jgi:arabinofuranosyltransferase